MMIIYIFYVYTHMCAITFMPFVSVCRKANLAMKSDNVNDMSHSHVYSTY